EEYGGTNANSECEQAHHVCGNWKLNKLPANRNGNAAIQLSVQAIRRFDQPAIQLPFRHLAVLLCGHLLPQILANIHRHDGTFPSERHAQFLEGVGFCGPWLSKVIEHVYEQRVNSDKLPTA